MEKAPSPRTSVSVALRAIRTQRGYSLSAVARGTGLSKSFLSMVESEQTDISVGRLLLIAEFYGISLGDLLRPRGENTQLSVVRVLDRELIDSPAEGILTELLAGRQGSGMTSLLATFDAGSRTHEPRLHAGIEFCFVITGSVLIEVGDLSEQLSAGDTAQFDAGLPHVYRAMHDAPATLLVISTSSHMYA